MPVINTIKVFIDFGWYTAPLLGRIKRRKDGKKTMPTFEKGYLKKYTAKKNNNPTALGLVLTGQCSNLVVVDCDNAEAMDLFLPLIPKDYPWVFRSVGKKGCNILFQYTSDIESFSYAVNGGAKFDFMSDGKNVYLPTSANETKVWACERIPDISTLLTLPEAVKNLLLNFKQKKSGGLEEDEAEKRKSYKYLNPLLTQFVESGVFLDELFRVITPLSFRDLDVYIHKGFLHPNSVPDGRGSEYLSRVSAIIGADPSVDEVLYESAIHKINALFSAPMPVERLFLTVIKPMLSLSACIDGEPIWKYEKNWGSGSIFIPNKRNEVMQVFYEAERRSYYVSNLQLRNVQKFTHESDFVAFLRVVSRKPIGREELIAKIPIVRVVANPARDFGFYVEDDMEHFNTFKPTEALKVFRGDIDRTSVYRTPEVTLKFLKSLVPAPDSREYLLRFIKRKFTYFEYSPVVLYFLGASGAGKDTFVSLLTQFVGEDFSSKPSAREFIDPFNAWLMDAYFVHLDEYGNQLVRNDEKAVLLGKLKAYTGSSTVQIRAMRSDGFKYVHSCTFVATANINPLLLEEEDRRMALFDCPTKISDNVWYHELLQKGLDFRQCLEDELLDFAHYLRVSVDLPTMEEYVSPVDSMDKRALISSSMPASKRIAYILKKELWSELEILCSDADYYRVLDGAKEGKIFVFALIELYTALTNGKGKEMTMRAALRGFPKEKGVVNGSPAFFFSFPSLRDYSFKGFQPLDNTDEIDIDI